MKDVIQDMERYAEANNVPIIERDSIIFIDKYIKLNGVKKVLEIGTAIGYSAILMACASKDVEITTIERDEKRYKEALKGIRSTGVIRDKVVHRGRRGARSYELQYTYTDEYGDNQIGCMRVFGYVFDEYYVGEKVEVRISGKDGVMIFK